MPKQSERWSNLKAMLTTLKFLRKKYYNVDIDNAISKMRDRFTEDQEPFYWAVSPDLQARHARYVLELDKKTLLEYAQEVEDEGNDSEDSGRSLAELAEITKKRLDFYTVAMAIFSALGIVSIKYKRTLAGSVCFATVAMLMYFFYADLKINGTELNEQYDSLRDLCEQTAADLVGFKLEREVLKYRSDLLKAKFGAELNEDEDEYD